MMGWKAATQTSVVWWICLLLTSLMALSRQDASNQTALLGDEGGTGSGPYSRDSARAANGAPSGDTGSGNETLGAERSSTLVKEAPNVSLEKLGQSLTRLEGSLGSLIQSFLAMQRSVSNLEQLQELLVLLLEDILKQTGNMAKSPKAIRKETDYQDPDTKSSNDSNEDDNNNSGGEDADRNAPNNAPRGDGAAKAGNSDDDFTVASRPLGDTQGEPQSNPNADKVAKVDATPPWSAGKTSREATSSGEDGSTSDDIDVPGVKQHFADQGRLAPQDKGPSRSPQWAEPMTIDRGNILAIFREAVSRLIARPPAADGQELQQFRLLREDHHEVNAVPAESPAERPPRIFEPLEVKTSGRNFLEKSGRTLPVQLRLSHLSPVVSHGGPLDGPEKSTSPFLEDFSDVVGKDYSGERPTGMINNLKLPDAVREMSGNDSSEEIQQTTASVLPENLTSFARRRRQAWDRIEFLIRSASNPISPGASIPFPIEKNITDEDLRLSKASFPQSVSVGSDYTSQINGTDTKSNGEELAWKDYDLLIDTLLKDLSDRLKQYQSHHLTGDVAIDRAVYELNKLIWMPSFDNSEDTSATNRTHITNVASGPENTSLISQPMESYTKELQFSATNESYFHKVKQGNSSYLIQSKKKNENFKAKQLFIEIQNNTLINEQESEFNQNTNSTGPSEWTWLASVPSAINMPETDLKWLTETLALLSQRQDLAKDMEEIAMRALHVLQRRMENGDRSWLATNTADFDKNDDLEGEYDVEGDLSERHAFITSIVSGNSLFGDERMDPLSASNRLDESIQQEVNSLKDLMHKVNTVSHQTHPLPPLSSENVDIPDLDSDKRYSGIHGQHEDNLENDEQDSEEISHEDNGHRGDINGLHVGQIHMTHGGHPVTSPEMHLMTFPTYLRHQREKRSRQRRLSGMLWRHFLQPQLPDSAQMRNQVGTPPVDQQHLAPTHQSRNNSVPYSNGPLSSFHHMYPYRRHLLNDPWGQRFLRPYGNPLGYANYMSHLGINNPNWIHQALEPDEPPANDVLGSIDMEDALAALFQRYWQRLFDVYSRSNPPTTTTEEPDLDGENATPDPSIPSGPGDANTTSTSSMPASTVITTDTASLTNWQDTANQTIPAT